MAKAKSCKACGYYWRNGAGYSDWTWLETEMRCALGLNKDWPKEEPYEGEDATMAFAEKCGSYNDCSYDGDAPLISPDGELKEGEQRAAGLVRMLSK